VHIVEIVNKLHKKLQIDKSLTIVVLTAKQKNYFFSRRLYKMLNIAINQKQAKQIAGEVYLAIAEYIKNHQQEYEQFLREEAEEAQKQNNTSSRVL
jgi:acetoin utilization deacetylase AcuC-like enzyme